MFGLGLQDKLEKAEIALRAALAERDEYLRQRDIALGERNEFCDSAISRSASLSN
jgi:hypothetical protein